MNKRNLILAGGAVALSLALIALPDFPQRNKSKSKKVRQSAPTVIELDEPEVIELPACPTSNRMASGPDDAMAQAGSASRHTK